MKHIGDLLQDKDEAKRICARFKYDKDTVIEHVQNLMYDQKDVGDWNTVSKKKKLER